MPGSSPPPNSVRFTKGEVNRAGRFLADLRRADRVANDADDLRRGEAWEILAWWRSLHARPLSAVAANLRYHVDRGSGRINGRIEVTQRLKRIPTLVDKLDRERGNVTQMQDIGGVRAVLPGLKQVYVVRRRLLKSWIVIRERDYIAEPKESGYRALHLIVRRRGYPIEVQLRTIGQDMWANSVEDTGHELGIGFKFGEGDPRAHELFASVAEMIAAFDRGEVSSVKLRRVLRHLPSSTMSTDEPD